MNKRIKKQIIITIIIIISFLVSSAAIVKSCALLGSSDAADNIVTIGVNYPDDNP